MMNQGQDKSYYAIQDLGIRPGAYKNRPDPETVVLLDPLVLRQSSFYEIFQAQNAPIPGLNRTVKLDKSEVDKWGILQGDLIRFSPKGDIISVNGVKDPKVTRDAIKIEGDTDTVLSSYTKEHWPVELFGEWNMRVMTMRSPLTDGLGIGIVSDGYGGKSYLIKKLYEQNLKLNPFIPGTYCIYALIDEKGQDGKDIQNLHMKFGQPKNFVNFFSPRSYIVRGGDTKQRHLGHYQTFVLAMSHAYSVARIPGMRVKVFVDGPGRPVRSHSLAGLADRNSGIVGGGIYNDSIDNVANWIGLTGVFGHDDGSTSSLTVISSILRTIKQRTAMGAFYEEVVKNLVECEWVLTEHQTGMDDYPKIDPARTRTRALERLPNEKLLQHLKDVDYEIFPRDDKTRGRNTRARKLLLERARREPFPPYMQDTEIYHIVKEKAPDLLQY